MPFGTARGQGFNNPALSRVVVSGTGAGDGVFVYAGTPGLGNPPIAWMTNGSLLDPYGNVLPAVMGLLRTGAGTSAQFALTTGRPAEFQTGQIYSYVLNLGLANEQYYTEILGPENINQKDAVYAAFTSSASDKTASAAAYLAYVDTGGGVNTNIYYDYSGTSLYVIKTLTAVKPGTGTSPANPATPESWHAMALGNGWTNLAGNVAAKYRKVAAPDNSVEIIGAIQANAATSANFFDLPAGYQPNSSQPAGAMGASGNVPAGLSPWVRCDSSGALTVQNTGAVPAAWTAFFHGFISLDA
jgi:hypothetical protein